MMRILKLFKAKGSYYKVVLWFTILGLAATLLFRGYQVLSEVASPSRSVQASSYDINKYISSHHMAPVTKVTKDLHTFENFHYSTGNHLPNGVVFHWTASTSSNDTARAEANYEITGGHWQNAFVHTFIDSTEVLNIHNTDFGAWGAGPQANARFVQFEFCNVPKGSANQRKFAQAILNAAYYTAGLLRDYGLKPSLASKSNLNGTMWTHHQVSLYLGGTDHTDPDAQFSRFGYSMSQFYTLVKQYYAKMTSTRPYSKAFQYNKYVSATSKDYVILDDLRFSKRRGYTDKIRGKVLLAKVRYRHSNGSMYLSLYDGSNNWIGYVNANGMKEAPAQGPYISYGKYVSFTKGGYTIYKNFDHGKTGKTSSGLLHKTYLAKGKYHHANGSTYLSLYDSEDRWVGYVNQSCTTVAKNQGGVIQLIQKHIAITKDNYKVWSDLTFNTLKSTAESVKAVPLLAKGIYHHFNGASYYSLYDTDGKWRGYLNTDGTRVTSGQTINLSFGKFVQVTKPGYTVWGDFTGRKPKSTTTKLLNQVLTAKWLYNHSNGSKYYSLYDSANEWQGIVNVGATQLVPNGISSKIGLNQYVAIDRPSYTIWKDLTFQTKVGVGQNYLTTPLVAKAKYYHHNGGVYYELYKTDGSKVGYMNRDGLNNSDGESAYTQFGKYVTLTKQNYSIWGNFRWSSKRSNSNSHLNQTYLAKGKYVYKNGSTFFSLYNHSKRWIGYINATGTTVAGTSGGAKLVCQKNVTIQRKNYRLWKDLNFNTEIGLADKYRGQKLLAKYQYNHFNGSVYYSLYSGTKWIGYINRNATLVDPREAVSIKVPSDLFGVRVSSLTSSQRNFLKQLISYAIPSAKRHGLYPSILVAQAVIESAWGKSELAIKAHAYFGVKADSTWHGKIYRKKTQEVNDDGKTVSIYANFRAYSTLQKSIEDYCDNILLKIKMYPNISYPLLLRSRSTSWYSATAGLKSYATNPNYVSQVRELVGQRKFNYIDKV